MPKASDAKQTMNSKILPLESLRGIAALTVVFDHFFRTFYPYTFVNTVASHSRFEWLFIHTPLFVTINGAFAVMIFFTLSGFVLSNGFFKGKYLSFFESSIKRYFRLMPVAFFSVILAYCILKFNLFFNDDAGLMPLSWKDSSVTLLGATWEGAVGIFVMEPGPGTLNSVLWTIYHELIGSILIFSLLLSLGHDPRRRFGYPLLLMVFANTNYVGFIAGMCLADIYNNSHLIVAKLRSLSYVYRIPMWLASLYLGSFPPLRTTETTVLVHKPLLFLSDYNLNAHLLHLIGACLMILLLLSSKRVHRLFSKKLFVYLGKISYSLYAVHLIALGSVGCFVFYKFDFLSYNYAALVSLVAYLLTSLLVASVVSKYVDTPSIRLSQKIGGLISSRRES